MTIPMSEVLKVNRMRKRLELLEDKLETIREFVLSRKYDIEMDIENFGMLKPVLTYFIEKEEK